MTFEEFAATRMPGVLRFAAVLTSDLADAEDLAQEVLIRAYSRWDRIGGLDRPGLYVRKMILNAGPRALYRSALGAWNRRAPPRTTLSSTSSAGRSSPSLASCPGGSGRCLSCAITRTGAMPRSLNCSAAPRARFVVTRPAGLLRCGST